MQNAEMEFVAFDAQDVIATSGIVGSWFTASDFTTPKGLPLKTSGTHSTYFMDAAGYYTIYLRNADDSPLVGVAVDKSYQLVCEQNSVNRASTPGKENSAWVVAEETSNATGTQINTWQGILDWITAYDNQ